MNIVSFFDSVVSAEVSEDSSLLAVSFSDATIKVWSLCPQKLRTMKDAEQLVDVERDAGTLQLYVFCVHIIYYRLVLKKYLRYLFC